MNEDCDTVTTKSIGIQYQLYIIILLYLANRSGPVIVYCYMYFIQGSVTESCYLIFIDNVQNLKECFNVTRSQQMTLNNSGNYTVKAYDVLMNLLLDPLLSIWNQ